MNPPRVAIFGHSRNAETVLNFLIGQNVEIPFICFPKDCSEEKISRIKTICYRYNISFCRYNSASIAGFLKSFKPELIFVASFPHILGKEIINFPTRGVINMHGSLLPKYRGSHPLNWVLINGESETGITLYQIDEGIDTGDIIAQKKVSINYGDDAVSLREKIYETGRRLLIETWPSLIRGAIKSTPQDDSIATYYRRRKPEDGKIHWHKQASEIRNLIRALVHPWPGAYCFYKNQKIIIERASVEIDNKPHFKPGKIKALDKNGNIKVTAGYNILVIEEVRNRKILADLKPRTGDCFV